MSNILEPRTVENDAAQRWHKETIALLKSIKFHIVAFWLPVVLVFFAFFFFIKAPVQEHINELRYSVDSTQIQNITYYALNFLFDFFTTGIALMFWLFPMLVWHLSCFHWAEDKQRKFKEIKNHLNKILVLDQPIMHRFKARLNAIIFFAFVVGLISLFVFVPATMFTSSETHEKVVTEYQKEAFFIGTYFETAYQNIVSLFLFSVISILGLTNVLDMIAIRFGLDTKVRGQGYKLQEQAEEKNKQVLSSLRKKASNLFLLYFIPTIFIPSSTVGFLIFSSIYFLIGCAIYIYWITYKTIMYRDIFEHKSGVEEKVVVYATKMAVA